jgi:hypothetical protein
VESKVRERARALKEKTTTTTTTTTQRCGVQQSSTIEDKEVGRGRVRVGNCFLVLVFNLKGAPVDAATARASLSSKWPQQVEVLKAKTATGKVGEQVGGWGVKIDVGGKSRREERARVRRCCCRGCRCF